MEVRTGHHPLAYQPALDGIRAVAVTLVLLFHAGFEWMRAGYLGVSIFFTLSGYLITSLLLEEWLRRDTVDLGRFFSRRVRRLLPPSMICLILIVVARSAGEFETVPGLRRELLGAVTNVFNWVRISGDSSYTDVFAGAVTLVSPLEHYWSLAIEEQFYLVWPLAVVVAGRWVLRRQRSSTRADRTAWTLAFIGGAFAVSSIAALAIGWRFGPDVAYWSTVTRLPELLAGATLAAVVTRWSSPRWISHVAMPALGLLVVLAMFLPRTSGPAYGGWMAPIGLLSAALLWGLSGPSVVRRVLSSRPFVGVGKVSYGLYLYHWPVFVLLRQHGWELTRLADLAGALALTALLTVISYVVIERPVRRAQWRPARSIGGASVAMMTMALVIALIPMSRGFLEANTAAITAASAPRADDLIPLVTTPATDPAPPATDDPVITSAPATSTPATSTSIDGQVPPPTDVAAQPVRVDVELGAVPPRPVRILTVGDSTAFYVGQALAEWVGQHPDLATSDLLWCQGCGFLLEGTITSWDAERFVQRSRELVDTDIGEAVARIQPDVVVLMTTINDVATRQWAEVEGPLTPADPRFADRLQASYRELTTLLTALGVDHVVWIVPPTPDGFVADGGVRFEADRWDVMDATIRSVAQDNGDVVTVVDAQAWGEATGRVNENAWRPDGTHLSESSAREMIDRWLAPTLIEIALGVADSSE